jgi:hypothetical protein
LAGPPSVPPERRRPAGRRQAPLPPGQPNQPRRNRQNINIQVGQIQRSKWAMPEYRTHRRL